LGESRSPEAHPTVHHQAAQTAVTIKPPPVPHASSGWPMPSHRTLTSGIMPSARSMLARSRHPCLRFASNAGSIGTGHPSRTRIPRATTH